MRGGNVNQGNGEQVHTTGRKRLSASERVAITATCYAQVIEQVIEMHRDSRIDHQRNPDDAGKKERFIVIDAILADLQKKREQTIGRIKKSGKEPEAEVRVTPDERGRYRVRISHGGEAVSIPQEGGASR